MTRALRLLFVSCLKNCLPLSALNTFCSRPEAQRNQFIQPNPAATLESSCYQNPLSTSVQTADGLGALSWIPAASAIPITIHALSVRVTETQRGEMSCPRSQAKKRAQLPCQPSYLYLFIPGHSASCVPPTTKFLLTLRLCAGCTYSPCPTGCWWDGFQ